MAHIFIVCGIDTDCGKTYITGKLAKHLLTIGETCITQKIVQTGCKLPFADDLLSHRRAMNIDFTPEDKEGITQPYRFSLAASPHIAAYKDQVTIDPLHIQNCIQKLASLYNIVLAEAAGGLCVPLTDSYLTTDLVKTLAVPIILVSSSKLGSINHTLLSIDFCIHNGINIHTIIYNIFPETDATIAESSYKFLKNYVQNNLPHTQFLTDTEIIQFQL